MEKFPTSATVAGIRQVAAVRSGARAANDEHGGAPIEAGDAPTGSGPDVPVSAHAGATGQPAMPLAGSMATGITAVVVTYNPDISRLAELLRLTRAQVEHVEVIDNGSRPDIIEAIHALCEGPVRLHPQDRNLGIGGAQNVGIGIARARGADYVLLLDHDSLPAPDMVARLRVAIEAQPAGGRPVGAAGPRYADPRQAHAPSPFVQLVGLRRIRCTCSYAQQRIDVEHLIASGCLIPLTVLNQVGDMNEQLFIDYVDIEWCLRASHAGYRILGVCDAYMEHELGDTPIAFLGKHLPDHSAQRHYYLFRNALLMYRFTHISLRWKVVDFYQLVLKFGFYALMAKPRWPRIRMMIRGLYEGLLGRSGPLHGTSEKNRIPS